MIKRWIVHVEFHRGYRPHISIKQMPRHGDVVEDGGVPGRLVACPTCSTTGFLHEPAVAATVVSPSQTIPAPQEIAIRPNSGTSNYKVGEAVWTYSAEYTVAGIYDDVLYLKLKHDPSQDLQGS